MISSHKDNNQHLIVMQPNRSMSWQQNKRLLLFMAAIALAIGIGFASIGAWMIFPFAGLEVMLVAAAMYYVSWKLNFRQELTVGAKTLQLQKGVYFPKYEWQWQRAEVDVVQTPSRHPLDAPVVEIWQQGKGIEVGEFLNSDDKKTLLKLLREAGLPPISKPKPTSRVF